MSARVLCVDDDPNILAAFRRQLRKHFDLEVAAGGEEGLVAVAERGPFAVILSDMRMPGMSGAQFLARVRQQAPDSVRLLLTGQTDLQAAIEAVNDGQIFRFLTKPCPPDVLVRAIEAGVAQHRLLTAEKELLEKTLRGSVRVLTEVLALVTPTAFGRSARVQRLVGQLARVLGANSWELELAAMLSQIGCVSVPEPVLGKVFHGTDLTAEERAMVDAHPQVGRDLLAKIPRLEAVADAVGWQERRFDGADAPGDGPVGADIPLAARVLKVALDYDSLELLGHPAPHILERLRRRAGWYDPAVLNALESVLREGAEYEPRTVRVAEMFCRMVLAENVLAKSGMLLVAKGQEITPTLLQRLGNFSAHGSLHEPIRVLVPSPGTGRSSTSWS